MEICSKDSLSIYSKNFLVDILNDRGIYSVKEYLSPKKEYCYNAEDLVNIDIGVELVNKHIKNKSNIFLIVDCDNDGVMSAAMMYRFLKTLDEEVNLSWMMHDNKQHGIELDKIPQDANLVIVPDAGSNQFSEHENLKQQCIDVLVLDHHLLDLDYRNSPAVIINNQICSYKNKDLSGAGVVFKFIEYYYQKYNYNYFNPFIDLAAVGIIGDAMKLNDIETRYIISEGLSNINNYGLQTFVKKQEFSISDINSPTPTDIAFYIVPLVNAVIRVGTMEEKQCLFNAFINGRELVQSTKRGCKPGDKEIAAEKAFRLATNCKNRQKKMKDKATELIDMKIIKEGLLDNKILIIALDDYESEIVHPNLTGLVATEFVEKYKRPTLILRMGDNDVYKGSGRGDSNSILKNLKEYLNNSGFVDFAEGHEAAFGCGIQEKNIDKLISFSNSDLKDTSLSETIYTVDYLINNSLDAERVETLAHDIDTLSNVWGRGVEEPLICIIGTIPKDSIRAVGNDKSTAQFTVQGIKCIKFKDKDFINKIIDQKHLMIKMIGKLKINRFCGSETPQFLVDKYELKKLEWT